MHNIVSFIINYFNLYSASDLKIIYLIISFLFAVPFFLLILILFIKSTIESIVKNNAVNKWASTEGTILRSEVVKAEYWPESPSLSYSIIYSFKVNEKEFQSDRVAYFTGGFRTRTDSETIVNYYLINSTVTVYYNLKNPEDCCLYQSEISTIIIETAWYSYMLLIVPAFFLLSSYGILFGNKLVETLCFLIWPGLFTLIFCQLILNKRRK